MKTRSVYTRQLAVEGKTVQEVDEFTYFGCEMQKDCEISHENRIRIGKTADTFRCMRKVWNENGMSLRTNGSCSISLSSSYSYLGVTRGKI